MAYIKIMIVITVNGIEHEFKSDNAANRFCAGIKNAYLNQPYFTKLFDLKANIENLKVKPVMSHADISIFDNNLQKILNAQFEFGLLEKPAPLVVSITTKLKTETPCKICKSLLDENGECYNCLREYSILTSG